MKRQKSRHRNGANAGCRGVEIMGPRWLMTVSYPDTVVIDPPVTVGSGAAFQATYLVSDTPGLATHTDAQLLNPWGIANAPFGPFWISDNNAGVSTVYDATGATAFGTVGIPRPTATAGGPATGIIYQATNVFKIGGLATSFIFSTEEGTIAGWTGANNAAIAVDHSGLGAVYKGLAIAAVGPDSFLYAPNFNSGHVDVFDGSFTPATLAGAFTDPNADVTAGGYAPFDIASINGELFVTYAKQNDVQHDDVGGAGNGIVDIFDTNGQFVQRLITGGPLDSPWGMAIAPTGFGTFAGDLLVGNFKDGRINAFNVSTGAFAGTLTDAGGAPITIPGLWALKFGVSGQGGDANTLYFTSGFGSEQHGLFGAITATSSLASATSTVLSATGFVADQPVTLSAGVTGATQGLVSFQEGGTTIASAAVDGTGHASVTVSTLGRGLHQLTAAFSGPGNLGGSTSGTLNLDLRSHADNQDYVNQIYGDLLNRTVDDTGLAYWTGVLESGGSPSDVAAGITGSREYLGRVVEGFYESFLGRGSDINGLNNWVDQLQAGATVEQVRTAILGSDEFFNLSGGTVQGFVTQVFHHALGRAPDQPGLDAWTGAITQGLLTRAAVAVAVSGSEEGRADTIDVLYQRLLHRHADAGGLAVWSQVLANGASETVIVESLVESAEYLANLGIV